MSRLRCGAEGILLKALGVSILVHVVAGACMPLRAADRAWYSLPEKVEVLPVFLVPKGAAGPSENQKTLLMKHLAWSQRRYREMLGGKIKFAIADDAPRVVDGRHTLNDYRKLAKGTYANHWLAELFDAFDVDRYSCAYVFLTVIMNPADRFPLPGGRPINGGYNLGGGIVVMPSFELDKIPNVQTTLQHELGHSFGLPHVDVYRYDMKSNASIMSYNPAHKTRGFRPGRSPGVLIPEDRQGLALNQRVFPGLRFSTKRDVPRRYKLAGPVPLGPMAIPGHADYGAKVTLISGTEHGKSSVANIAQGRIQPAARFFNPRTMWLAGDGPRTWVAAELEFPDDVALDRLVAHTQHNGKYNMAAAVRILARLDGTWAEVASRDVQAPAQAISFNTTTARTWRVMFQTPARPKVCVRGLQFFSGKQEVLPPEIPPAAEAD